MQFLLVMESFGLGITVEGACEASVGSAIGVHHQDHPFRSVQAYRLADLFQDEFTIALLLGRSQALGSPSNLDGVGVDHANLLEELAKAKFEAVVETPENGRIALILSTRSIEVEDLFHGDLSTRSSVPGAGFLRGLTENAIIKPVPTDGSSNDSQPTGKNPSATLSWNPTLDK